MTETIPNNDNPFSKVDSKHIHLDPINLNLLLIRSIKLISFYLMSCTKLWGGGSGLLKQENIFTNRINSRVVSTQ